ncbi:hypothetical protein OAM14_04545 [Candidatus Pelagibacter sp.]|nr:hypothetical protein [Candidatus Pelagibacter sp.]
MAYKLLEQFRSMFTGQPYLHRKSNQGDIVASYLFEDLYDLGRSKKFVAAVKTQTSVSNRQNKQVGLTKRRGDGTFGEKVPNAPHVVPPGLSVAVGEVATIEIGAEVKVLAKAMIKQLDRVGTDMENQVKEFKKHGGKPICVGIIGVNRAPVYTSYEGKAVWKTDGKTYKHPIQEADDAERRLVTRVAPSFDEIIVLRFTVANIAPFNDFQWVDLKDTEMRYGAALVRISREYEHRF